MPKALKRREKITQTNEVTFRFIIGWDLNRLITQKEFHLPQVVAINLFKSPPASTRQTKRVDPEPDVNPWPIINTFFITSGMLLPSRTQIPLKITITDIKIGKTLIKR